jgi:hypothetical protein
MAKENISSNYFFLLLYLLNLVQSSIIIKFKRYLPINPESKSITLEEFINKRINNIYTTNLFLGNPPQTIPGFLKSYEHKFYLSNEYCPNQKYFYKEKSKTFSLQSSEANYIGKYIYDTLYLDSINSNKIKLDNFSINVDNDLKSPQCFHIGTQLSIKEIEKETNIIDILHKQNFIKSYFYEYKISNDDELFLELDLNIDINKNNEYKFIKPINIKVSYYNINQKWGLSFYKFKLNNYTFSLNTETQAEFNINYGCFFGITEFKEYFEKYLEDNDIFVEAKYIEREFYIYFFKKNLKNVEKLKNIELVFYHRELNFNFTFTYEDLFIENDKGYYFLVIFDYKYSDSWKFGYPFFKKYNFVFNHDSNIMGFTNSNINNNIISYDKNINDKYKSSKIICIVILGLVFAGVIILLFGILIGKKIFSVRKVKVNELLELYDYKAKDSENQNTLEYNK